ncbi:MAG: bifunctional UDP-N-acetylglucosamine diphosphorylase/glucosamine-1-phosphate N-acetyltransferase GlmU [Pseudomonadales bacterium]|nr:bifunctional UDP-N-acetylglucosamine diphosphorylase/glucosamine-1-phosphate N-acetyltransferase GlmU [Pseudomonadales bacterium]
MNLEVVILAAGQGTRMKSKLPKVLHPLAGKPLLSHVVSNAKKLGAQAIHVVVGHGAEQVKNAVGDFTVNWVVQEQQLGTGHAVAQAMPLLSKDSIALVLYGDVPLTSVETLKGLLHKVDEQSMALLTVNLANPTGYGRIIRDTQGQVQAIIEEKDATVEQRKIREGNTGILAVPSRKLQEWLPRLSTNNAQGEYYLTDTIAIAVAEGMPINAVVAHTEEEVQGVNSRQQLALLERWYQLQKANELMAQGVSLADPARLDIRGQVSVAQDIFIDANVLLEGNVSIGEGVCIGPNVVIKNSVVGEGVTILANSVIESAEIEAGCQVGPFARLRPGTHLAQGAKIGNFVEIKKAYIGVGSKVSHLSYVGDAELGKEVNIGAGTITCNYDGANKFKTEISDGVFVGSNTALVAPIKVGENATIGAGSTLSRDVEPNTLVVARAITRVIKDWQRPTKKK